MPNQDQQTSVIEQPQANHRRRCVSELGPQFPSTLRNKLPRVHSVSDSLSIEGIGAVSGWSFDPEILQSGPGFDSLDDPTNCEVATFDFSTYSPQTLHQGKEPLPSKFVVMLLEHWTHLLSQFIRQSLMSKRSSLRLVSPPTP